MATTTNYSFNKPTINGSENTWGSDLNGNWDSVDSILYGGTAIQPNLVAGAWKIGGVAITSTAAELNYVSGVTSGIQAQINTKAPTANPTFTGTATIPTATITTANVTTTNVGGWTVTESGTTLTFSRGGTNYMILDASGNLSVRGNVTAYNTGI